MTAFKVCVFVTLVTLSSASPTKPAFWKGTSFDSSVEEMRSLCTEDDPIACLKYKAISFLDSILQKDNFQISEGVEVTRNNNEVVTSRSENSIEDNIEGFIKTHDVKIDAPLFGTKVTLGARNLDSDEIDLKLNFGSPVEARKSKLKKIVIPILVFVLLKAMTLVPLALGILGLKAWNALQLSFFSFIVAVGLAVFQLCKKIASEHAPPQISAHPPWEAAHYAARALSDSQEAQNLAYSAHKP
ncbi:uncharacterized protein LOC123015676 [Tribolium madens]|uniref:uncharacterized protein LOC123015676 n=1 Tax=Tribolium madens TaxID=41895 RepID=UPI001CF73E14|nr:uncharacterized protein LOC123015676 [Tribolium madens]